MSISQILLLTVFVVILFLFLFGLIELRAIFMENEYLLCAKSGYDIQSITKLLIILTIKE